TVDSRIGLGTDLGLADLGSRLGLASDDEGAVAVWTDTRSGNEASIKQNLYAATVRAGRSQIASALRYSGYALMLAGLLTTLIAGRSGAGRSEVARRP
ncbi:MAG: hypothetical protein KY463_15260, partial [Actinobacteria bacterium]|nr:hypothetical protein [Actinomycetota bacterium]